MSSEYYSRRIRHPAKPRTSCLVRNRTARSESKRQQRKEKKASIRHDATLHPVAVDVVQRKHMQDKEQQIVRTAQRQQTHNTGNFYPATASSRSTTTSVSTSVCFSTGIWPKLRPHAKRLTRATQKARRSTHCSHASPSHAGGALGYPMQYTWKATIRQFACHTGTLYDACNSRPPREVRRLETSQSKLYPF